MRRVDESMVPAMSEPKDPSLKQLLEEAEKGLKNMRLVGWAGSLILIGKKAAEIAFTPIRGVKPLEIKPQTVCPMCGFVGRRWRSIGAVEPLCGECWMVTERNLAQIQPRTRSKNRRERNTK